MQTPTLSLAARSPDLEDLIEKARAYIHAAKAPATLRAYRTDFEDFTRFCKGHNLPHLRQLPQPLLSTSPTARAPFARRPSPAG
jgi:site-specific recombinase XerD